MTRYRWTVVGFGFLAIVITYMDRAALSYAISPLETAFGLTNTDFGLIAAAFGVGYLIMTVGGGILVDCWGARKIWSLSAILWSLACACTGFATGFIGLFIFRLMLGITEGPSFPALTRVAADWLPMSERARALAIGLAAVPFASVVGAPLISHLIALAGWRTMFVILGILGIIWGIVWFFIFRDRPEDSSHVSREELQHIQDNLETPSLTLKSKVKTSWRFMLSNRALLVNNYAFFSFGYLLFFAITWLPGYLEQSYGIKLKEAGWFLMMPWMMGTVLLLLGGIISDYLWEKTQSIRTARSHIIWICQILSAISFIPVVIWHSLPVAVIGMTLGIGFGLMPNAAFYAINTDLARDRAATSLGVMDCAFAFAGIIAPFLTGLLASLTGGFSAGIVLLIGLTFTSALTIIIFQHPDQALVEKGEA